MCATQQGRARKTLVSPALWYAYNLQDLTTETENRHGHTNQTWCRREKLARLPARFVKGNRT